MTIQPIKVKVHEHERLISVDTGLGDRKLLDEICAIIVPELKLGKIHDTRLSKVFLITPTERYKQEV